MEMICIGNPEFFKANPVITETARSNPTRYFKNDGDAIAHIKKYPAHLILVDAMAGLSPRVPLIRHLRRRGFYSPMAVLVPEDMPKAKAALRPAAVDLITPQELGEVIKAAIELARSKSVKGRRRTKGDIQRKGVDAKTGAESGHSSLGKTQGEDNGSPETTDAAQNPDQEDNEPDESRRALRGSLKPQSAPVQRRNLKGALDSQIKRAAGEEENPLDSDSDESPDKRPDEPDAVQEEVTGNDDSMPDEPDVLSETDPSIWQEEPDSGRRPPRLIPDPQAAPVLSRSLSDNDESAFARRGLQESDPTAEIQKKGVTRETSNESGRKASEKPEVKPLVRRGLQDKPEVVSLDRRGLQDKPETIPLDRQAKEESSTASLERKLETDPENRPLQPHLPLVRVEEVTDKPRASLPADSLVQCTVESSSLFASVVTVDSEPERMTGCFYIARGEFPSVFVSHYASHSKIALSGDLHLTHRKRLWHILENNLKTDRYVVGIRIHGSGLLDTKIVPHIIRMAHKFGNKGKILCFFGCNRTLETALEEHDPFREIRFFNDENEFETFARAYRPR